ncbi:hypothetical protein VIGAN_02182700 [Vigna angularis var. angularis]|uniref:Pentatricopeptide repeat-containing protein n=1 Tax=Vigna angularis var. angularis TaxID=157739 RepID=A0A0S3REB8_PHAAN|nr:hypothetical protein VIGAN_02182700 [Vigna angularis var. angularis]
MVAEGVVPDVSTFNILIQVLMLEDMPNHGLRPDEKTFTTFMQGFIEEGDVDGALRIKELMVELKKKMLHIKFFLSPPKVEEYLLMNIIKRMDKKQSRLVGHLHVSNLKEKVISCLELQIFLHQRKPH